MTKGFVSLAGANIIEKGLGVIKLLVASRLLGPAEIGLYGLALVVIMTMEQLTQVGVESALIQKEEVGRADKDTSWALLLMRGLVLGGLAWWVGPSMGAFFSQPGLVPLVRILAVGLVISSMQSIEYVLARRELRFEPWFWVRMWGGVVDFTVSIGLALAWENAWALVVGYVSGATIRTVVGYFTSPYAPKVTFSRKPLKYLLDFGRWAGGLSVVLLLLTQGDDLLVGKALGVAALGIYQLGYKISNLPTSEVTHVLSNLTLPLYSRLKNTGQSVAGPYLSIIGLTAVVSAPTAIAIVIFARAFVSAFLGNEWLPAVPIIQLLALWGVTRSLDASAGALFFALGRPDLDFKLHLAKLVILAALVIPALHLWGVVGVAGAVVVSGLAISPITLGVALRLIERPWTELFGATRLAIGASIVAGGLFLGVGQLVISPLATLGLGATAYAIVGSSVVIYLWRGRVGEATGLLEAFDSRR